MKRWVALATALFLAMQPCIAFAQTKPATSGPDTRLYLADGNVVIGQPVGSSSHHPSGTVAGTALAQPGGKDGKGVQD